MIGIFYYYQTHTSITSEYDDDLHIWHFELANTLPQIPMNIQPFARLH